MMIPKFFFWWMVLFFFLIIPAEIMGSTGGDIYTPHLAGSDFFRNIVGYCGVFSISHIGMQCFFSCHQTFCSFCQHD